LSFFVFLPFFVQLQVIGVYLVVRANFYANQMLNFNMTFTVLGF